MEHLASPTTTQGHIQLLLALWVLLLVVLMVYKFVAFRSHRWGWRGFLLVALVLTAVLYPFALGRDKLYVIYALAAALVLLPVVEALVVRRALRRLEAD